MKGRATLLPNITRPYTDAASARVGDMLLPTDDRNWALKPADRAAAAVAASQPRRSACGPGQAPPSS